jgi:hypothetical protein
MEDVKEKSESFRYDRISSSSGGGMFFSESGRLLERLGRALPEENMDAARVIKRK